MQNVLEIQNKQREIKHILKIMGWSLKYFAGKFIIDTNDYDVDDDEINKFHETFKKQVQRPTTNIKKLENYICFLKTTDEYKKQKQRSPESLEVVLLEGLITDYQSIIDEETNITKKKVLEVAVAYALSIGSAWNFHIIPICVEEYSHRYLVIWTGDVGNNGGSRSHGPECCEVLEGSLGHLYVSPLYTDFDTGLQFIDHVVGFKNNELTLIGYNYDEDDPTCCPSLKYENTLLRNEKDEWEVVWEVVCEKYLCKIDCNE